MLAVSEAVAIAVKRGMTLSTMELLQPVGRLQVRANPDHVGTILNDLSSKRMAHITMMDPGEDIHLIEAEAPLSTMVGYASVLRSITSGSGSFSLEYLKHSAMSVTEVNYLKNGR